MRFFLSLILVFAWTSAYPEVLFIMVRHGETDWNAQNKVQGHADIPLNEKGICQAKVTAEMIAREFPDIKAIYSSDLSRAYYTALETANTFHLPIEKSSALREIDVGSSEGMLFSEKVALYKGKWDELDKQYPDRKDRWNHTPVPGEETINAMLHRVKTKLIDIARTHPNEKVAIFTHGKVIKSLISEIGNRNEEIISNGEVILILYDPKNHDHPFTCLANAKAASI